MSTTSRPGFPLYIRILAELCLAYLAAFGLFHIVGLSDDYIRPLVVLLAVGAAELYLGRKELAR